MLVTKRFGDSGGRETLQALVCQFRKGPVMNELKKTSSTSSTTVRGIVESLAARFSSSDIERHQITDRAINVILENPELDLSEPRRELLPIVQAIAAGTTRKPEK